MSPGEILALFRRDLALVALRRDEEVFSRLHRVSGRRCYQASSFTVYEEVDGREPQLQA